MKLVTFLSTSWCLRRIMYPDSSSMFQKKPHGQVNDILTDMVKLFWNGLS